MTKVVLARTPAEVAPYVALWDRLAVGAARPLMRPAWLLAWWHARVESAQPTELRVALAFDDQELVGVLPLHVHEPRTRLPRYGLLGEGTFWGQAPLLLADAPRETLTLLAEALAASVPTPAVLPLVCIDPSQDWVEHMAASWPPRGAWLSNATSRPSLTVTVGGEFEDWLWSVRPGRHYRRKLKQLAERGVILRQSSTVSEFRSDLAALARLHHVRWANRSQWLSPAVEIALDRAGSELLDVGGARLWVLAHEDGVVGATLNASAGGQSCGLLTAFDRDWAAYGPGNITMLAGIEDAFTRGERLIDLGHGAFEYQRALADSALQLASLRLFPRGNAYPVARARWAPTHAREHVNRLRGVLQAGTRLSAARTRLRRPRSRDGQS
jgi:CelD/BcsL family acetyltransferase involved in cellulose biosynthesis